MTTDAPTPTICRCGETLDTVKAPVPGDVSICAYCGAVYQFDEQLVRQPLDVDAIAALVVKQPGLKADLKVARFVLRALEIHCRRAGLSGVFHPGQATR